MTGGLHVVVEADGGSRGNPGPAGYGAVVRDASTGAVLAERKGGLGTATNNVAEYTGLLEGLRAAAALGAEVVEVRMDSQLAVEQMSGRWKIKNAVLRPLAAEAAAVASGFARVGYTWIPRAENTHADRLANEAMDEQAGLRSAPGSAPESAPDAAGSLPAEDPALPDVRPAPARWSGAQGAPTRLFLLRHGQTAMSVDRRYSGRGDVELTDRGRAQAAAAGKRLSGLVKATEAGPVPVVCSPLRRTLATGQAVAAALGTEVGTHDGLIETDFGDWEGLTFLEAAGRDPELHRSWLSDTSVPPPGGESFDTVLGRVREARDDLLARYAGRSVVVVSHVTPIKTLLRLGLGAGPEVLFRLHLDLASLSIVEFYPDGNASVRLVNDVSHLEAL